MEVIYLSASRSPASLLIRLLVSKITVDQGNYHTDQPFTITRVANRMLDDDEAKMMKPTRVVGHCNGHDYRSGWLVIG